MGCLGMTVGYFAFATLHFFQFILAIVVAGLYGVDLNNARKAHVKADGKWVRTSRPLDKTTTSLTRLDRCTQKW